jgi:hypothetical protein
MRIDRYKSAFPLDFCFSTNTTFHHVSIDSKISIPIQKLTFAIHRMCIENVTS